MDKEIKSNQDLIEACKLALDLIKIARNYFPKSMKNNDKFQLELTCAAIIKATHNYTVQYYEPK